jgi:hypothetical protein
MIKIEAMNENANMIESMMERAAGYGKTSYELIKLKAIDKTSDIVSSFVPLYVVFIFILFFVLFLSIGLALWFGEIFGKTYYGFFLLSACYGLTGIFIRVFMYKWLKTLVCNKFIKQVLK